MLPAILQGKVSSRVHGREDVLTSCVFTALDTLPSALVLAPWLGMARQYVGEASGDVGDALAVDAAALDACGPNFWPTWGRASEEGGVEPDVLFDLETSAIIVEAKFGSGPSGMPSDDETRVTGQLTRQWKAAHEYTSLESRPLTLIYLTAHWSMPKEVMGTMVKEAKQHQLPGEFERSLYWLSWRSLYEVLCDVVAAKEEGAHPSVRPSDVRMICRLQQYLEQQGLDTFTGVSTPARVSGIPWRFETI